MPVLFPVKFVLVPALLIPCFATAQEERFEQDRFAIGFWVPPLTEENLRERYREIAEANFTLVIGGFGSEPVRQLELCEEFGLRAIVSPDSDAGRYPDGEACWGYLLADEPGQGSFPDLAAAAEEIRSQRPGRFGYVNLLPNYAPEWALGGTYEEHVGNFIRIVQPEVLSMDHYPLMRPGQDTRHAYLDNLEVMRRHSVEAGIPFWNFFYTMPFNDRIDPTEAQIRWQIFTSVAYGAKGVLYFCYWTPGKGAGGAGEFPKGGAIITAEGRKTRHYYEAQRINAELKNLGPTLMQLTGRQAFQVKTGADAAEQLQGTPIRSLTAVPGDPTGEFIVGVLEHEDGRRAVVMVNHSYSYTAWPTVEFDAEPGSVLEVCKRTSAIEPVVDDSPELSGLQLSFGAGDARLFLLPET